MDRLERIRLVEVKLAEEHGDLQKELDKQSAISADQALWHYTSADGLIGILQSRTLWATSVRFLNDSSEWQYGRSLVRQSIEGMLPRLSDRQRRVLTTTESFLDAEDDEMFLCVTCFCEDGDLLSQWRGYASRGAGYAIAFDPMTLSKALRCDLRRMVYSEAAARAMLDLVIATHLEVYDKYENGAEQDDLPGASFVLAESLVECLSRVKHPSFAEEREWRLIYRFYRTFKGDDPTSLRFRSGGGRLVPYVELPVERISDAKSERPRLPIQAIRHGPVLTPREQTEASSLLLWHHGYSGVSIFGSEAPLRV